MIFKKCLLWFLLLPGLFPLSAQEITYPYNFTYNGNPLARNHGASDPSVHVWDSTVWMYTSLDHNPGYSAMDGYHAWSSTDLVNWTDYGDVFNSSMLNVSSWGATQSGWMWAPGAARKQDANGVWTYYLYYPHNKAAAGAGEEWVTGVATAPNPWGPFTDQGILGGYPSWKAAMDPMVFIDDDGQAYIYANSAKVSRLNPDMVSLAEAPKNIVYATESVNNDNTLHFGEGSYMHKKDGVYYFSYSNFNNNTYQGFYATGKSPYGPFEWKGPMAPNPAGAQDHHSIIDFKGQWYYFYHIAVGNYPLIRDGQSRIACFDRLFYNKDGTIQMVVHTSGPTKVLKTEATNGSVLLNPPGGAYAPGKQVTLSASGDLGFAFNSWSGDLSGSENPATIVMDTDKSVTANFDITPTYSLSVNSANGSVLINPAGGVYNSGSVVSLTPVKNFGYKFDSWSGDLSGSEIPGIITMDSDKEVTANFIAIPTYTITGSSTNGIIEFSPPGGTYEEGTTVSVNAKRDFGYQFSGWSGDLSGIENPALLLMDSDKNITANFSSTGDGKIVFATNCGGGAFRSDEGINFSADNKYSGGGSYSTNSAISGTTNDVLYQNERFGNNFSYTIPLSNGKYEVNLLFAEIFHNAAGKRVFNVTIENTMLISNLDIWSKAGKNAAYQETHEVTVSDGYLNINFSSVVDNAKVSAIYIKNAVTNTTGSKEVLNNIPGGSMLEQNFPNPFSKETIISYQLNKETHVNLAVYNTLGQKLITLVDEDQTTGKYSVNWNVHNYINKQISDGIYFYRLETDHNSTFTKKLILSQQCGYE